MLKTNQDRLVMQSVLGEIQHPTVKELPVRLDCDGVAHTLPNTGSITYNVKLGDSVYGLAGDHIEPGVTIKNHNAARENEALNVLSCIGNDAGCRLWRREGRERLCHRNARRRGACADLLCTRGP